ncbi:MAG: ATP-binding protein, partial [Nitrospinales bacterium]
LISNSLKYAFPKDARGCIEVSLCAIGEDRLELTVRDDGTGMPPDLDIHSAPSLGLQLVATLAEEQLEGTLELEKTLGTCFKVVFDRQ